MASTSSSTHFSTSSQDLERPKTGSIWAVVAAINQQIHEFISDKKTWKSVKLKCISILEKNQPSEYFEFSDHSVLSNLYWGIENIEVAIKSKQKGKKSEKLENAEQMLQTPAMLDQKGYTSDIPNTYLICCSYFYLSVVKKLQGDMLKVALHFLQAMIVSPGIIWNEFAPEQCRNIFLLCNALENEEMVFDEKGFCEGMGHMARKYKGWLTYHQVMSYGETKRNLSSFDLKLQSSKNSISLISQEHGHSLRSSSCYETMHVLGQDECKVEEENSKASNMKQFQEHKNRLKPLHKVHRKDKTGNTSTKRIPVQDLLTESQSDTRVSDGSSEINFSDEDENEVHAEYNKTTNSTAILANDQISDPLLSVWKQATPYSTSDPEYVIYRPQLSRYLADDTTIRDKTINCYSRRFCRSFSGIERPKSRNDYDNNYQGNVTNLKRSNFKNIPNEAAHLPGGNNSEISLMVIIDKVISKLCLGSCDEHYTVEVVKIYEILSQKRGVKYTILKDIILDQLLKAISNSREVGIIRVSISILSIIVYENKKAIKDLNKNGLELYDLASALKRNIHEAAILIHLINPSPIEIRTLELLPTLMEIICSSRNYKGGLDVLKLTPTVASLRIIEVLVTAFDNTTNNMHLAEIITPRVFSGLLSAPRENNIEDFTSLAAILLRCMQFDGLCRKYIFKSTPMAPFVTLLGSNHDRTKLITLEFFHEILRMPRSSSIILMQQILKEECANSIHVLTLLVQQMNQDYKLLAANLLLQLYALEDSPGKSTYREEALAVFIKSLACEEDFSMQRLSAFLLANMGGTYAFTGEPYTVAWLLKKTGLTSHRHRNMIRNFYWSDESLNDSSIDKWCSKMARILIKIGKPLFLALEKGLNGNLKEVSRDCLTACAWISYEIAKAPNNLRCTASEILLSAVEQFLHPGYELDERLLACLCIYNYASGKGMHRITNFSEGVRESLRRLTSVTWMAQELLRVADFFQPNKWRISCVHTQILEAGQKHSGSVTTLIYYRGQLCGGYSDGSIKVWDIKGHTMTLAFDAKEHKKAVTCFSLFESGDCLLSGSTDKTIRVWRMIQRKLECVEIIPMKEPIRSVDTQGEIIFALTKSNQMKVLDPSRTAKDICKAKKVKYMRLANGKVYAGCIDSSIQELHVAYNQEREIKAPSKIWMIQSKPINSIVAYKDWLYSASTVVEGSSIKEWRRGSKAQISLVPEKGTNVLAMEVVEDFIYVNSSSSTSILQIWLRGTQQKVGRLSAGSKITSLLTGNDIILCGTEAGLIKGWIPL